jgi:tRNA (cmo5U34)-methyltransferase
MLHNIQNDERTGILIEVCRILRPNGRFVNGDKIAHDDESQHLRTIMDQFGLFIDANRALPDNEYWLGWIEHYVRDNQSNLKLTEHEILTTLRGVGFGTALVVARQGMEAVVIADK